MVSGTVPFETVSLDELLPDELKSGENGQKDSCS